MTKRITCTANQWVIVRTPDTIEFVQGPVTNARQIADASYDPNRQRLRVTFRDSTTMDVSTVP